MRARARHPAVDGGGVLRVVVDEKPGLFQAAIFEFFQGGARGSFAVLLLADARIEARAKLDEAVQEAVARLGFDPPHARIGALVAPAELARKLGLADAAEAAQRFRRGHRIRAERRAAHIEKRGGFRRSAQAEAR